MCVLQVGEPATNDRAAEFHAAALVARIAVLGDNHPDVAASIGNLGAVHEARAECVMTT